MNRPVGGLSVLIAALAFAAPAGSAGDDETFDLAPGVTTAQQHQASTYFAGSGTDVSISGAITSKATNSSCVYDAFYYVCSNLGGRPTPQANVYMGNVGYTHSDVFEPPYGNLPPYNPGHTYGFTSGTTGRFYFWAYPHGEPAQGTTYGGSIEVTLTPVAGCSLPKSRGAGAVASAVQNEVRVTCVESEGCSYHKGGSAAGAWIPVEKDTVLKQGDELSCDPDSKAVLAFADNSTVRVGNTTQLKIASFFTDGGVVRTEILLKMGEVAAQVNHSEATKSDFHIQSPTGNAGVRGTIFSVFYDPGSRASVTSVNEGVVNVDPTKPGLKTVNVPAGKEVEVTGKSVSKIAPIGKSDVRGGISRLQARDLVFSTIAATGGACGLVTPRTGAFSVKPKGRAWLVSIKATGGKAKGTSTWRATASKVAPVNARAKKIARGCG